MCLTAKHTLLHKNDMWDSNHNHLLHHSVYSDQMLFGDSVLSLRLQTV